MMLSGTLILDVWARGREERRRRVVSERWGGESLASLGGSISKTRVCPPLYVCLLRRIPVLSMFVARCAASEFFTLPAPFRSSFLHAGGARRGGSFLHSCEQVLHSKTIYHQRTQ